MIRLSNIDLRLLSVFLEVVEQEGLSAAAEATGASLSKVTRDIAAIEDRLGMRLCHRGRAGFSLTREGDEVYRAGRDLMEHVRDFELRLAKTKNTLTHAVDIGIVDNMIANPDCPLIEILQKLSKHGDGLTASISVFPVSTMDFMVRDRQAEIGFTPKTDFLAPLIYQPAFIERHALFVSRNCKDYDRLTAWKPGRSIDPFPYVARSFPNDAYTNFEARMPLQVQGTGNSLEAILAAVSGGIGAGILPRHAAAAIADLIELPFPDSTFDVLFNVIIRRDMHDRGAAGQIFRILQKIGRATCRQVQV